MEFDPHIWEPVTLSEFQDYDITQTLALTDIAWGPGPRGDREMVFNDRVRAFLYEYRPNSEGKQAQVTQWVQQPASFAKVRAIFAERLIAVGAMVEEEVVKPAGEPMAAMAAPQQPAASPAVTVSEHMQTHRQRAAPSTAQIDLMHGATGLAHMESAAMMQKPVLSRYGHSV